ncbi:cysteine and histidine-rich protein 1 homolog isoform X1 [Odontomachus brunneus]|uniref:cysteine and histidine-rich protein 1 homolog isoform X1 n=2 Tax=Odontomachus brunneus TaxID=486640 RepID=UPI0013F21C49|nr:cysteine and histidine-rich protein 1 homolog isoform X1 [Odontomachus brunneus]
MQHVPIVKVASREDATDSVSSAELLPSRLRQLVVPCECEFSRNSGTAPRAHKYSQLSTQERKSNRDRRVLENLLASDPTKLPFASAHQNSESECASTAAARTGEKGLGGRKRKKRKIAKEHARRRRRKRERKSARARSCSLGYYVRSGKEATLRHLRISCVRSGENSKTSNMADPSNEPASSSGVSEQAGTPAAVAAAATPMREDLEKAEDFLEPDKKRRKVVRADGNKTEQKLEHRLGGILCCAVCLDLPRSAVYQCTNGHLMCAGCFTHVLADARLRDELATCPNCRIEISKTSASRNLAVEKAVSELPAECQYCAKEFPRNFVEHHEDAMCEERISSCKFSRIGCPWRGPNHERLEHEAHCVHPHRTGADVMEALLDIDARTLEERRLYDNVFDLLSYEKITFNDLQMKPYRTDEFVHKLFYETSRFSAFNNQWVVKARINSSQRDPTQSSERDMTYQLILKSKTTYPLPLHYLILKGPFGDMKVQPRIHRFEFTEQDNESPYLPLPLPDTAECNRLLAAKAINFRLIMFLASK